MSSSPLFRDPTLPFEQRIEDLIGQLSLVEKCAQLRYDAPAIERLGIPAYNWWNECLHGVARNGRATVFPQAIGLASSWDPEWIEHIAGVISDEARAKHHEAIRHGSHQQYQGLTFWTPNINIFRDPRWGRGQETWGEDPTLTGEMGAAFVRGLQGNHPKYLKTAACAKHYAVHSGPEELRHEFNVEPSRRDLWETYLPAFERLCQEGVESFMGAYNAVYGEPCCGSPFLLQTVLREKWGFEGHVVSDCWAVRDFHSGHNVTNTPEESAALAVKSGCDLNCGDEYCLGLEGAALQELVSEAEIDTALRRVFRARFRLGLFDPEDAVPWSNTPMSRVACPEHRALSFEAAVRSLVLLKNDGVLPLAPETNNILLTGPLATSVEAMLGNYFGLSGSISTVLEGFAEHLPEGTRIDYRKGCLIDRPRPNPANWTAFEAAKSDVVICCLGLTPDLEGEEGDAVESHFKGDRQTIELPESQRVFAAEIAKTIRDSGSKAKVVVVLFGGSAFAIPELVEQADAILHAWYPGEAGGEAVAAAILGKASPGGRLPITFPRRTDCLPPYTDYSMAGRTYRFMRSEDIVFPFGYGLNYGESTWSDFDVSEEAGTCRAAVTIHNPGTREISEVVQCYLRPPGEDAVRLVAFQRVTIPAGKAVDVKVSIPTSKFLTVGDDGERRILPGDHSLVIGPHAPVEGFSTAKFFQTTVTPPAAPVD